MGSFDLDIDKKAFAKKGVELVFDKKLYLELLKEYAADEKKLKVELYRPRSAFKPAYWLKDKFPFFATYDSAAIKMPCVINKAKANKLLLHETKHFIDDSTRSSKQIIHSSVANLATILLIVAAIGVVLFNAGQNRWAVIELIVGLILVVLFYRLAPNEVAARIFAKDPKVTKKFGEVITFKSINT